MLACAEISDYEVFDVIRFAGFVQVMVLYQSVVGIQTFSVRGRLLRLKRE